MDWSIQEMVKDWWLLRKKIIDFEAKSLLGVKLVLVPIILQNISVWNAVKKIVFEHDFDYSGFEVTQIKHYDI